MTDHVRAEAEAELERLRFIDKLQEEGDKIAADLTETLDLPDGARVVFELDDSPQQRT